MRAIIVFLFLPFLVYAQQADTLKINQNAIYNRPFIDVGNTRTAVGGYLEGNTNYQVIDGVTDGFSMEMRRFNIFLYSRIHQNIKFLSELEFEHGTNEIALETALIDFELNPALNIRGGIILPAIGIFNTNHDSPNWEFIERPLSSTELIPSTLSEVGFGLFGKFYPSQNLVLSYDAYVVNGLQENVILNSKGITYVPFGKTNLLFEEDKNGSPMLNSRIGIVNRNIGEIGLSIYGGKYNKFRIDGINVEPKRTLVLYSIDYQFNIRNLNLKGEWVETRVDVPETIREIYGSKQRGGFIDLIYPVGNFNIFNFSNMVLNISGRLETVDYNVGNFYTNIKSEIGDEIFGYRIGLALRPVMGTIIRANYGYHFIRDILNNPSAKKASIQIGIASYF